MAAKLFSLPRETMLTNAGFLIPGAKVTFYTAGTSTEISSYTDSALSVAHTSPVVADAAGRFPAIYLDASAPYKVVITDASDVTIYTEDNIGETQSTEDLAAIVHPRTPAEISAGVTPVLYQPLEGDIDRYGAVTGGADISTALSNAILVAEAGGSPATIHRSASHYALTSPVVHASLAGNLTIKGVGNPEIRYTGSATNVVLQVTDTNDYDVCIENITINCNSLAATGIRVDNPSASMASVGFAKLKDVTVKNPYLTSPFTYNSTGISVVGGFKELIIDNPQIVNVDRELGSGVAGSRGCAGILVSFDNINAYVEKMTVIGGHIDTVTNEETTGNAADVDVDGIIYSTPTAVQNSNVHLPASFSLWGTKFTDCKGRCIKTQTDGFTSIRDVTVVRGLEEAINNATDFDLQRGGGNISGVVYYANETAGAATSWGTGHKIINYGPDQGATADQNRDGGLRVSDFAIYSAIPSADDALPIFALVGNDDTTRQVWGVSFKDCTIAGGRVTRFLQTSVTSDARSSITVSNCQGDFVTSLVRCQAGVGTNTKLILENNVNTGTDTPVLLELASTGDPYLSAFNNTNFVKRYIGDQDGGNDMAEVFRPTLIGGDTTLGHTFATAQTVTLADDASHAFNATGNYGVGIITNNFNAASQAVFTHTSNAFTELYQDGATSALITYGTTTDPDIDGDLNIWITGNDTINITNKLGSERIFHLWHIGGD